MDRKCDSDNGINQSKDLRRIVPTTRSQIALAIGQRGGDFNTLIPRLAIDSPRCSAKILSRSRSRSVPPDHRLRAHHYQCIPPVKESREYRQQDSRCWVDSSPLRAAFNVESELSTQKEVLGLEGSR
jgi:hypothetical protein